MFNRVLIAIDENTSGRDAIALGLRLVSPTGKVVLAYVHPRCGTRERDDAEDVNRVEREVALGFLDSVNRELGLDAEVCSIGSNRIGAGLHRLAERTQADLLVLGSSAGGRRGRVLLTDETRHALNGAPCAVAAAPLDYADTGSAITEIGVAYNDGSQESRSAILVARALANDLGATLTAFEALPLPIYDIGPGVWSTLEEVIRDQCRTACARIAEETGLRASAACGDTVAELAMFSGIVDLLVVGSRSYGPLGRLVHGSTTLRLSRYARSPLLILTRGARLQGTGPPPQAVDLATTKF
jgi:nucleotide-binding universal stress UspA family protein